MTSKNVDPIINISNPVSILQQQSSQIITNPFIPNDQKIKELEQLDKEASDIIEQEYNKNKTTSIANLSIKEINKNISLSCIGLLDDLFVKPNDISWSIYIPMIIQKDQRYAYIGVLFIIIAIFILLIR
jgi:hypothetical protein